MAKLATIRKNLFFENQALRRPSPEQVLLADHALDRLISELPPSLRGVKIEDSGGDWDDGQSGGEQGYMEGGGRDVRRVHEFQRHLMTMILAVARMNIHMAVHDRRHCNAWEIRSRRVCVEAVNVVREERRKAVPLLFRKNWVVSAHTVTAGIFFILDYLESQQSIPRHHHYPKNSSNSHENNPNYQDSYNYSDKYNNLAAVSELIASLQPLAKCLPLARRGAHLLQRLLRLVTAPRPTSNSTSSTASVSSSSSSSSTFPRKRILDDDDDDTGEIDLHALLERIGLYPPASATQPPTFDATLPAAGMEQFAGMGIGTGLGSEMESLFALPVNAVYGEFTMEDWDAFFPSDSWMLGQL